MIRASLKGMLGRKLRTGLTAFAVLLGVAMVSGAFVVTDTMLRAADQLENVSYAGSDAVISHRTLFRSGENGGGFGEQKTVPASLAARVRALPQVAVAAGEITDVAKLTDKKGKVSKTGAPPFAVGFDATDPAVAALSPLRVKKGAFPRTSGEVAIDAGTAKRKHYGVGDSIGVVATGPIERFRISGIVTFGEVQSIGHATASVFTLADAQRLFQKPGGVDTILVAARRGVTPAALRAAIAQHLPPGVQVQAAKAQDRFDIKGLKRFLDVLRTVLIAFGVVALFVGGFIIFNTLSITVAQRARELGLLRMIGASRGQVMRSVVLEAAVTGLIASTAGLVAGLLLAKGLTSLFRSFGIDLPQAGTVFATRTVIVAYAIGLGVTTLAGLAPAVRATRVAPVAALRDEAVTEVVRRGRQALYVALAVTALGIAGLAYGMFGKGLSIGERLSSIGAGCLVLFVGVALFSPRLVRPLASSLGRAGEAVGGFAGRLARENSMRNPGRTATTAAALMIGLALVTFVAVLGEGLRASYGDSLGKQLKADYVVTAQDGFSPFQPGVREELLGARRGTVVTTIREDSVRAFGRNARVDGVEPATVDRLLRFKWSQGSPGSLRGLGEDGAIVTKGYAKDHHLSVGSPIGALSPTGARLDLVVRGVDDPPTFNPLGLASILIPQSLYDRSFQNRRNRYVFASVPGGPSAQTTAALRSAVRNFPDAKVQTRTGFRKDGERQLGQFLNLLYALLALSVIVSLFGIVNTLVLSVFERTRELGMLRAVGMTRRQVRQMVRLESVIVALIGAVLGMVVGIFLAALVTTALRAEDISFGVPVVTLVVFLVVATLAGVVAAILPARRASRLNVLEALQYE